MGMEEKFELVFYMQHIVVIEAIREFCKFGSAQCPRVNVGFSKDGWASCIFLINNQVGQDHENIVTLLFLRVVGNQSNPSPSS